MGEASCAMRSQTPSASKMRRLALPSAVVRSSKLGCAPAPGATLSMRMVDSPVFPSATARLAPTIPPPTMATSKFATSGPCSAMSHHCLDLVRVFRCLRGQHLVPGARDHHIVLDADADPAEPLGHAARTR